LPSGIAFGSWSIAASVNYSDAIFCSLSQLSAGPQGHKFRSYIGIKGEHLELDGSGVSRGVILQSPSPYAGLKSCSSNPPLKYFGVEIDFLRVWRTSTSVDMLCLAACKLNKFRVLTSMACAPKLGMSQLLWFNALALFTLWQWSSVLSESPWCECWILLLVVLACSLRALPRAGVSSPG